ncbi:TrkH family potassium uptake protein [Alphaproteobacteria bacterium]|jgi:trk system potassium uptake protein TrkH|nr:TrkH family potassium uptake protein [Alphaproteobacteria bacterium]
MFNFKPIALVGGTVICAVGFLLFIPLITEIIYQTESWQLYAVPILLYLIVGGSMVITNRNVELKISTKEAFIITSLSWILLSILCAVPFIYTQSNLSVVDSIFESMSGITTTGATIITNLDELPKGILIWRALLQWLGGIGIIVIALVILPFLRIGGMQLFHLEGDDPYEKFLPKISSVVSKIIIVYLTLTFLLALLYYIYGMNLFDAIAHSFTTISTGGFSTHNESFAYFKSNAILNIAIIFMIIGSIPFLLLAQTTLTNIFNIIKDHQVRLFLIILIISITIIYFFAKNYVDGNMLHQLSTISFNTISIISGTGYVSDNFENWGNYASVLFLFLMFIGGCAGSTTGGLKVFRFQILFKYIILHLKKMLQPHMVISAKFNGKTVPESTFESVMTLFIIYIITFVISALLLSFSGIDFLTCISAAASAISNVGPGLGDVIGPEGNYSTLNNYSKFVLIVTMFLGRLEMLTIFILFLPSFWKN